MTSDKNNPKGNLIRGAAWTVGTRWSIKAIGFVNTIIMARLLAPEDYGIVAMGMLVVLLIQTFLDFSATVALLRKDQVTREEIDSAWTLRVIQGGIACLVILATSPLAVAYFEEPRLKYVLWTLGICVFFGCASNVGLTLALKNYDFKLDFKVQTISKIISVLTTIVFGYLLHDFRALVLGIVAGYFSPLILGYVLHPYRPRIETSKMREIWDVTKWLLLSNIGTFILRKGDEIIAGRLGSTHEFGLYNVGSDLGQLPVGEIGPAMLRALLPVLSTIQEDVERTKNAVLKTFAGINTVIWPIGLGFAAISHEATELILGIQWTSAAHFVAIYAVTAVLQTSIGSLKTFLVLKGATRVQNHIVWIEFLSFVLAALALVPSLFLTGLAFARLVASLVAASLFIAATKKECGLEISPIIKALLRPALGASAMFLLVTYCIDLFSLPLARMCFGILVGAVFYTVVTVLSWRLVGYPEGLESTINEKLKFLPRK